MDKFTKITYSKIEKDLISKVGLSDTKFILDKFGRGQSFLDTIYLLPTWFHNSFSKSKSKYNLKLLGEANLKAWLGYTLYDYIRDGKIPREKLVDTISIANIYTHEAFSIFIGQADSDLKKKLILNLFNKIDLFYLKKFNFNKAENFNSFSSIVHEKSIAAGIPALLVIPNTGYSKSVKSSLGFFKHYFTARQLSDDLDDYKKDIKLKINTPVTMMSCYKLNEIDLKNFIRKEIDLNFDKSLDMLKKIKSFDHENFINNYVKAC